MVVGITMVKDEADIVARTVGHMQTQVDHVIVSDNGSTDGTREILEQLGVELHHDRQVGYYQSQKMSRMARWALDQGADWVVPFDADELWRAHAGRIADVLMGLPDWIMLCEGALFDHVATGQDPDEPDPVARIQWRRPDCLPLPKVACRARKGLGIHQGNHGATYRHEPLPPIIKHLMSIRHFPYRSVEQFVRKVRNGAAAYAATHGLPDHAGEHWRQWGKLLDEQGEEAVGDIFRKWYWRAVPDVAVLIEGEQQPALVYDPA